MFVMIRVIGLLPHSPPNLDFVEAEWLHGDNRVTTVDVEWRFGGCPQIREKYPIAPGHEQRLA
jgi:hypothetical protein